jgi:hypothetical protein
MQLSAVFSKYNVPLTKAESNLIGNLSGETPELSDKSLKELAAARDVLKQMPDRQTSERRSRMGKAAMLKERLKMLRQMLHFLSPAAAKSLKSEMKQIAGEIASLNGGNGGNGNSMTVMDTPNAAATGAKQTETIEEPLAASEEDQGKSENNPVNQEAAGKELSGQQPNSNKEANAEERALKETISELKSLFKTVLEALKRKQKTAHNVQDAAPLRAYASLPESGGSLTISV